MVRLFFTGILLLLTIFSLPAQKPERKSIPSEERAVNMLERISKSVTFSQQQKKLLIPVFTKFYDDVHAQKAFQDAAKLEILEKERDTRIEKLLNNKKLFLQYKNAIAEIKAQFEEHRRKTR